MFLCVLPSQVPAIADEVKADIPQTLFLYSFASSISSRKLRQLFNTTNVIHPEYTWDQSNDSEDWDFSINVIAALENKDIVSTTCPLRRQKCKFLFNQYLLVCNRTIECQNKQIQLDGINIPNYFVVKVKIIT